MTEIENYELIEIFYVQGAKLFNHNQIRTWPEYSHEVSIYQISFEYVHL